MPNYKLKSFKNSENAPQKGQFELFYRHIEGDLGALPYTIGALGPYS